MGAPLLAALLLPLFCPPPALGLLATAGPASPWLHPLLDFLLLDLADGDASEPPRIDMSNLDAVNEQRSPITDIFLAATARYTDELEAVGRVGDASTAGRGLVTAVYQQALLTELAPLALGRRRAADLGALRPTYPAGPSPLARDDPDLLQLLGRGPGSAACRRGPDPATGGALDPASACALHRVLQRAVQGDPAWFPSGPRWRRAPPRLAASLHSLRLSSLLCAAVPSAPPSLLLPVDRFLNAPQRCSELPSLQAAHWRDPAPQGLPSIHNSIVRANVTLKQLREVEGVMRAEAGQAGARGGFGRPSGLALQVAGGAAVLELVTSDLAVSRGRRQAEAGEVEGVQSTDQVVSASCTLEPPPGAPCDHTARYRTFSGRCNNLHVPASGSALQPLRRLLPARYQDSVSAPRGASVEGPDLPNARLVSLALHQGRAPPDTQYTLALMQWGQFIDHDVGATPQHRAADGGPLDCSACDSAGRHPACFPVPRPRPPCFGFIRSLPGQQRLGPRQQLNQITSFLDASMVYGSDACVASQLREGQGALLRTTGRALLPTTEGNFDCRAPDGVCFLAGDDRVNEQPGLTGFHTVLLREHNGIAEELGRINPGWAAERVFQEARRVVAALVQHVTFSEFLPRVLGLRTVKGFGLDLLPFGYYKAYDADCSAGLFNEFATAAFRFGHSLIGPNITLLSEDQARLGWREGRRAARSLPLRQLFHDPSMLRSGAMPLDSLLRGLVLSPMMPMDPEVSDEILNHLFEEQGRPRSGMDLAALNIQRGRDHGLPGYNSYRPVCGLPPAAAFSDLLAQIPAAQVAKLAATYHHPDDIDLFPGLLSETLLPGAMVGPTLACILGLQFAHLRQCDRFWYETADPAVRFNLEQLRQIRGETLAGLLCRNMDLPGRLPGHAMDQLHQLSNEMVDCAELVHRDLEAWREAPGGECQAWGQTIPLGEARAVGQCQVCTCTAEGAVCAPTRGSNACGGPAV